MDKAPVPALKLCQTRASLVSNVDSRANETYTGQGGRYEMPAPSPSLRRDSDGLSVGAGSRAPAGACSGQDAAPTKWVTLPDWKVIPLPPGQTGERVCSPSELRQLLGQQVHQFYARDSGYKERDATSHVASENYGGCGGLAVLGRCKNGHFVAKELVCGREWCARCGQDDSAAHTRRFARWLHKARHIAKMGYWVIEWPDASRSKLRTKRELSDMGKRVKSCFVELGYKRGLRRWHWFGDQRQGKYNPHLNILVDGCHISKERLESIKEELREKLNEPSLIVNYHYRTSPKEMVHTLKYVTRATFLVRSWDEELADELFNFQNSNYWGVWPKNEDEAAWSLEGSERLKFEHIVQIQNGKCPICGEHLEWSRPHDSRIRSLALAKFGINGDMLALYGRGFLGDDTRDRMCESMHRSSISERMTFVRSQLQDKKEKRFRRLQEMTEANLLSMNMVRECGAREIGGGYWIFPLQEN